MNPAPIALTIGEPAGIGPELAVAAWEALRGDVPFFLIGDPAHLPDEAEWQAIAAPDEALQTGRALPVLVHPFDGPRRTGQPQPAQARGVVAVIERAVALARSGKAGGICTLPIHKQALQEGAGFGFPGHTEFLAHLCDTPDVVMMLAGPALRVVPVTIHIPLSEVKLALTPDLLETRIRITHAALRDRFGIDAPRLAVAGLNPHAGEGGRMGREEIDVIAPVLKRLRSEGMDIAGPLSADTMFHAAARDGYDAAICMYHDQALIPIKTLDFDRGVNVTLGLPIVRTSPDHGTAFDIAGQGLANPGSTVEALRMAWRLAGTRRGGGQPAIHRACTDGARRTAPRDI
ncbi:4-hydroxythreonine-4-phosphate dehydrogenase PdxA [Marivita sp. GX14005]|uniref:4-hydroxythreonine-4-phosphate dehydrogenase PdxA n=1 Tax=Marivita sp. GX14005 TaxID=2942276 RepID=UPI002018DF0A|nr:4-hydroxythreonine-4-phosphate dehydrogenase PdxA [Marivita sp. GX14005]MCL3883486.1 4-hydroxythreonine-4-phosphate dehydrogenase PdxA [Marivita sp. GX14005]